MNLIKILRQFFLRTKPLKFIPVPISRPSDRSVKNFVRIRNIWSIALLSLISASATVQAQETEPVLQMSLTQAIEHALNNNYQLQNARADARIADRQVWEITADGLPQVNGTVGYQKFIDIPTNLVPAEFFGGQPGEFAEVQFGTEHNLTATLSVTQLVFDGSYIVGLRAARIFRELSRQSYQKSEIDVKSLVTESYYLALATSQNLDIVQQNLINLESTLYESEKLFEEGFMDAINLDQLKLTVANLKNSIAGLKRQKSLTLSLLKFQIGIGIEKELELTDNLENLLQNISIESLAQTDFDFKSHIDFKIMLSQENMQLMAMRRQQSFYMPSISAFYTRQESAQRNEFNLFEGGQPWYPTSMFGVNIQIPIFSSGLRWSRVQQAKLELEKARNNTRMVEQSLLLQRDEATNQIETAMEQYNSEKENLQLAERILKRTQIMHKEGLASSLELTQASDQLLTTQSNYINAIFELLNAKNNLEKALGKF